MTAALPSRAPLLTASPLAAQTVTHRVSHLAAVAAEQAPQPRAKPRLRSDQLFAGTEEIEIEHGNALYRLRITSLGKLILTK